MFLPVEGTFDGNATMAQEFPNIRLFAVTTGTAPTPASTFPRFYNTDFGACGPWMRANEQVCLEWQPAVRPTIIGSFSATCLYTAIHLALALPPGTRFGLIHASYVGTAMNTWSPPEALAMCPAAGQGGPALGGRTPIPTQNSSLFNGMIHPIIGYGLRGVLWNQGEADMGRGEADFGCRFQALIATWRARWAQPSLFWGFVQLGTQPAARPSYVTGARLGQSDALPGRAHTNLTAMAVTYDVGDAASVHARNKTAVGARLARALLHESWGMGYPALNWAPPALVSAVAGGGAGGEVVLTFASEDGGGVLLADTHDCWECCAGGRDDVQLYAMAGGRVRAYVNTTVRLGPRNGRGVATSVVVTPVLAGSWSGVYFARGLWPQCGIFGAASLLPAEPFNRSITV